MQVSQRIIKIYERANREDHQQECKTSRAQIMHGGHIAIIKKVLQKCFRRINVVPSANEKELEKHKLCQAANQLTAKERSSWLLRRLLVPRPEGVMHLVYASGR